LALAWILRRPEISATITGATKAKHVLDNVAASDVELTGDVLKQIEQILDNDPLEK
jgi:aryl-alcohol dehydrogenase-like predicted oxidoreductase